ncbi:MAG: 2Fe-2S iron-sulfur cluster binding domain-containing protein [Merismopedia sp. SIO2A8]|nr:2Fe-2S iron-sulfur cluster binding domain-containing protein [Symploca sp. SIO2B6]NET51056.1 2Fe-2S iron-sulfur cluster binding domain-containing protein [Merismopedia sp. SIO2A8]
MTVYQVRLITPGGEHLITVPDNEYILDIAEDEGIRLPSGCRQGDCSNCLAKAIDGTLDQGEQRFLSKDELTAGYAVTCVAYARSDCTLQTHQEQILYQQSLYTPRTD